MMRGLLKKKLTTIASVACLSLFMAACGSESADQAAVDDAQENLQESTDAASEAVREAANDAEELVKSQSDASAMDEAGDLDSNRKQADSAATIPTVVASRIFSGPGDYPPESFAAYGIVAFPSTATATTKNKYVAICVGYLSSISPTNILEQRGVPTSEQMVTVWPLKSKALARDLNSSNEPLVDRCSDIVSDIDLFTSQSAIKLARQQSGDTLTGEGPYLLAWSPSKNYGQASVVLVMDLSEVTTAQQATHLFRRWTVDIEKSPALWVAGWNIEKVRTLIGLWADKYGDKVLKLIEAVKI